MACPAPTAAPAAQADATANLQSLADLLRAKGAVFDAISSPTSACTSCPILRVFSSGGRGIATHTHTPKGTTLLRIPYSCMYTCERAKKELGPDDAFIAHLADENEGALLAMLLLYYCAHAFGTYVHTHGGTDSSSETHTGARPDELSCAYVRTLPPASDFALMCTEWDDASLALVPDPEFVSSARKQRADLVCEWAHWQAWLGLGLSQRADPADPADPQLAAPSAPGDVPVRSSEVVMAETTASGAREPVETGNGPVKDALRSIASWGTYSWARHCVMSRTFVCGLEMDELFMCDGTADLLPIALVPLADMLNHVADEGAAGAAATTDWRQVKPSKEPEACFLVKATRAYGPGEQVCISYGDRPNTELVQTYGFYVPHENNPADAITLSMRVLHAAAAVCAPAASTAAVGDLRRRLLDDYNNPEGVELIDADAPPSDTLSILRILAIDDDDMRSRSTWSPEMLERPLSRENELRSIRILQHAVATTASHDLQRRSPGVWDLPHVSTAASGDADHARTMLQAAIKQDTELCRYVGERAKLASGSGVESQPPWARRLRKEDAVEQRRAAAAQLRLGRWQILAAALSYCQRMLLVASGRGAPTEVESVTCSAASDIAAATFALEVQEPWSMLLLTGRKSIETRAYAIPTELLNVPIALVESPVGGLSVHGLNAGSVIGVVEFDGCAEYPTRDAWAAASDQHRVQPDAPATAFGWPDVSGAKIFGWHVRSVRHVPRAPLHLHEENRVLRSIFRMQ